jgi:hypothetical protein
MSVYPGSPIREHDPLDYDAPNPDSENISSDNEESRELTPSETDQTILPVPVLADSRDEYESGEAQESQVHVTDTAAVSDSLRRAKLSSVPEDNNDSTTSLPQEQWPSIEEQMKYWEMHDAGGNVIPDRIAANEEQYQ